MFECNNWTSCPNPNLAQTGLSWTPVSAQTTQFDSIDDVISPGQIVQSSVIEFICGFKIKEANEIRAIMCDQDNWSTQTTEDFSVISSDFDSTSEELLCNNGYFVNGIQTKRQETRQEPEYHLAYKDMGFTLETSTLTSNADPTIDGSTCVENDIGTDSGTLWVKMEVPDNTVMHYVKGIVLQKRGDAASTHLITEFTLRYKRIKYTQIGGNPDDLQIGYEWVDYDSGNAQQTGQTLADGIKDKRYIYLDNEPIVGTKFQITFADPGNTGAGLMSARVDLLIQKLAHLQHGLSMNPSEDGWGWPNAGKKLGNQKGYHNQFDLEGEFHVHFDFGGNYYVNEIIFQKEARPHYEFRTIDEVKIEFKSLDDNTWHQYLNGAAIRTGQDSSDPEAKMFHIDLTAVPIVAKQVKVFLYKDTWQTNDGITGRMDAGIQYYYPSNITELSVKCAKRYEKTDNYVITSSDMKFETNPEEQDLAYWQDDYLNFFCGVNFKVVDQGFYGSEVKYCYDCTQYVTEKAYQQVFEFEVSETVLTDIIFNDDGDLYETTEALCSPSLRTLSNTENVIFDASTGQLDVSLVKPMSRSDYTLRLDFPTSIWHSFPFTIQISCGSDSVITSTITEVSFEYFTNSSSGVYSFSPFLCSIPTCCEEMVYTISTIESLISPSAVSSSLMSTPELVDSLMVSQVDTSLPLKQYFWVQADNQVGQQAISLKIKLKITEIVEPIIPTFVPNYTPIFESSLPNFVIDQFQYQLPSVLDLNDEDTYTITTNREYAYIKGDRLLIINPRFLEPGEHEITIYLSDQHNATSEYTFEFKIEPDEIESESESEDEQEQEIVEPNPVETSKKQFSSFVGGQITSIDNFGMMTVEFSDDMVTSNLSYLNSSSIKISIKSYDSLGASVYSQTTNIGGYTSSLGNIGSSVSDGNTQSIESQVSSEDNQEFSSEPISLSWDPVSLSDNLFMIQLKFADPDLISTLIEQDMIFFEVIDSTHLTSVKGLPVNKEVLTSKIQQQSPPSYRYLFEAAQKALTAMKCILLLNFFLLVFFCGSLKYIFIFVRSLQLIVHLPIFMTVFPANALIVTRILFPFANYNLELFGIDWSLILGDELRDNDLVNDQMKSLGYQTTNSVMNLGTISTFVAIYLFLFVMLVLLWVWDKLSGKGIPLLKKIQHRVLFFDMTLFTIEGFLMICISGYLQLQNPSEIESQGRQLQSSSPSAQQSNVETISTYFSYLMLFLTLFVMPSLLMGFLFQDKSVLLDPKYEKSYGKLYQYMRHNNKLPRTFFFSYMVRRIFFMAVAYYLCNYPSVQAIGVVLCSIIPSVFMGTLPYQFKFDNRLEIFNELLVSSLFVHLLAFREGTQEQQISYGWSFIVLLILFCLVNMIASLRLAIKFIYMLVLRQFNRFNAPQKESYQIKAIQRAPVQVMEFNQTSEQDEESGLQTRLAIIQKTASGDKKLIKNPKAMGPVDLTIIQEENDSHSVLDQSKSELITQFNQNSKAMVSQHKNQNLLQKKVFEQKRTSRTKQVNPLLEELGTNSPQNGSKVISKSSSKELSISPQLQDQSNPSKNLKTQAQTPVLTPVGNASSKPPRIVGAKTKKPIINGKTPEDQKSKGSFSTAQGKKPIDQMNLQQKSKVLTAKEIMAWQANGKPPNSALKKVGQKPLANQLENVERAPERQLPKSLEEIKTKQRLALRARKQAGLLKLAGLQKNEQVKTTLQENGVITALGKTKATVPDSPQVTVQENPVVSDQENSKVTTPKTEQDKPRAAIEKPPVFRTGVYAKNNLPQFAIGKTYKAPVMRKNLVMEKGPSAKSPYNQ